MEEDNMVIIEELYTPYRSWRNNNNKIGPEGFKDLIKQVSDAVKYLHNNGIIHCDIKADNLLIKEKDLAIRLVVGDFSSAISRNNTPKFPSFTETHCPWEVINGEYWDEKIDSWSLGCCIFEMVYNRLLFLPHAVVKGGKVVKKNVKSYNNCLYFWALYNGEIDERFEKFEGVKFTEAKVPQGFKRSDHYHDKIIMELLKVFPENRKKVSDINF